MLCRCSLYAAHATVACMLCRCGLYAVPLWPVCCATVAWPSRCMLCRPLYTGHSGTARRPCAACRPQRYSIRATLAAAQHTGHSGTTYRPQRHSGMHSTQGRPACRPAYIGAAYRRQRHSIHCRPQWHSGTVFRPERHSTNRLQRHSIHATSVCTLAAYKPHRHSILTGHSGTTYRPQRHSIVLQATGRQRCSIVSMPATAAQHSTGHSGTAVQHAGHSGTACGPRNRLHVYIHVSWTRSQYVVQMCVYLISPLLPLGRSQLCVLGVCPINMQQRTRVSQCILFVCGRARVW